MKKLVYFVILLFITVSCNKNSPHAVNIMSFNIWVGGGHHPLKNTADIILQAQADIIGVQESTRDGKNSAVLIADSLGFSSYVNNNLTIISKYPIVDTSVNKHGVKIQINKDKYVWMFNIHLIYCPYEPYQLNGIEYCGARLLSTAREAIESAWKSRGEYVMSVVEDINNIRTENYPIFLTGDFNEPSYLDWTERATNAGLCIMPVEWPSTKVFTDEAGMNDAYRKFYADEVSHPGHTWTSIPPASDQQEVMDRIDFVFYNGEILTLNEVKVVGEKSHSSDIQIDNYPSDHRAVIARFNY